jgi:hypothetical protein
LGNLILSWGLSLLCRYPIDDAARWQLRPQDSPLKRQSAADPALPKFPVNATAALLRFTPSWMHRLKKCCQQKIVKVEKSKFLVAFLESSLAGSERGKALPTQCLGLQTLRQRCHY